MDANLTKAFPGKRMNDLESETVSSTSKIQFSLSFKDHDFIRELKQYRNEPYAFYVMAVQSTKLRKCPQYFGFDDATETLKVP